MNQKVALLLAQDNYEKIKINQGSSIVGITLTQRAFSLNFPAKQKFYTKFEFFFIKTDPEF